MLDRIDQPSGDGQGPSPSADIFEVEEFGALRATWVREPRVYRDLYPDFEGAEVHKVDDLIDLAESCYPLALFFGALAERVAERLQVRVDELDSLPFHDEDVDDLQEQIELLQDVDKGWKAWLESLIGADPSYFRGLLDKWLDSTIDWHQSEWFPSSYGPRGAALNFFENFPSETLEALGVELIYGDSPGSTHYAAELRIHRELANAAAARLGLALRFVAPGHPAVAPAPAAPAPGAPAQAAAALPRFAPAFGLPLEAAGAVPGAPVEPAAPLPPRPLRSVHDPVLFASAWRRVERWVKAPTEVFVDGDGFRHVNVLGAGIYTIAPDGRVSAQVWEPAPAGGVLLDPCDAGQVALDPLPYRWLWFARWERCFVVEAAESVRRRGLAEDRSLVSQWARWVFSVLRRRLHRSHDLRAMRRAVVQAVRLDPLAIEVARRYQQVTGARFVTDAAYNRVVDDLESHRKIQADGPELAVLFEVLKSQRGFPAEGEPLERLRSFLLARGVTPRGWRMIVRSRGSRLLPPAGCRRWAAAGAVLDVLRLLDAMQWREAPPRSLLRELLALRVAPRDGTPCFVDTLRHLFPALRHIVHLYEAADSSARAAMSRELVGVIDWLDLDERGRERAVRGRPSWKTLVVRARAWEEERLAAHRAPEIWPPPPEGFEVEGHVLVWVQSARELLDEGRAMRHCVFDYVDECVSDQCAVASVRNRAGIRVATLMVRRAEQGAIVAQLAGVANRPVAVQVKHPEDSRQ